MIDAHLHVVNFLQHVGEPAELADVFSVGDLEAACVFGLPVKKKWAVSEPMEPSYYLDDNAPCSTFPLTDELVMTFVSELTSSHGVELSSIAPLMCGFDPTDLLAVEHVERMAERFDGWRGIGEVLLRHDDLTELTYGENARAGHPALDPVLEYCAGRGWTFSFHQDSSAAGRWAQHEYVEEVEAMLRKHHDVAFVWCHAGVSPRVTPEGQPEMLSDLLRRYENLHLDLSWAALDQITGDSGVREDWLQLVCDHPDRFVLGSDVTGDFVQISDSLARWTPLRERLPRTDAALVTSGNARRLWFDGT